MCQKFSKQKHIHTMTSSYKKDLKVYNFDWAMGLNRFSLRLMGVWPDNRKKIETLDVFLRTPLMILIIFFGLTLPQCYALVLVINELPLVMDNLMTNIAVTVSCIKLFFIWRSKQALEPVIASVTRDWERTKFNWELETMRREASKARIFTTSGYIVLGLCYTGFVIPPLFGLKVRLVSNLTDYGDRYLPVQSYFPYDYSKSPNYELTHISQMIGGLFVSMTISIPDNYFSALIFHTSGQFEILGLQVERMIGDELGWKIPTSREIALKLRIFVDRHVHLKRNITIIEDSFTFIILAQTLCMSVTVCCMGFNMTLILNGKVDESTIMQIMVYGGSLFTFMVHTLIDCCASEYLALRTVGVFYNVFNTKWFLLTNQSKARDLIPMMLASKNPRYVTAGKIFSLSLETYCSILKTTAGYISILIAINKR